jgi:hypothetical protein
MLQVCFSICLPVVLAGMLRSAIADEATIPPRAARPILIVEPAAGIAARNQVPQYHIVPNGVAPISPEGTSPREPIAKLLPTRWGEVFMLLPTDAAAPTIPVWQPERFQPAAGGPRHVGQATVIRPTNSIRR